MVTNWNPNQRGRFACFTVLTSFLVHYDYNAAAAKQTECKRKIQRTFECSQKKKEHKHPHPQHPQKGKKKKENVKKTQKTFGLCPFKKVIALENPHMFTPIKDNDYKAALTSLAVTMAHYQKCDHMVHVQVAKLYLQLLCKLQHHFYRLVVCEANWFFFLIVYKSSSSVSICFSVHADGASMSLSQW